MSSSETPSSPPPRTARRRFYRRPVFITGLLAAVVLVIWYNVSDASPYSLVPDAITAYRLDSRAGNQECTPDSAPGAFHGWTVGATADVPPDLRQALVSILRSRSSYSLMSIMCFEPGMGFRIGTGADQVDVLICLHCQKAYFFKADHRTVCNLSGGAVARLKPVYEQLFGPLPQEP